MTIWPSLSHSTKTSATLKTCPILPWCIRQRSRRTACRTVTRPSPRQWPSGSYPGPGTDGRLSSISSAPLVPTPCPPRVIVHVISRTRAASVRQVCLHTALLHTHKVLPHSYHLWPFVKWAPKFGSGNCHLYIGDRQKSCVAKITVLHKFKLLWNY